MVALMPIIAVQLPAGSGLMQKARRLGSDDLRARNRFYAP